MSDIITDKEKYEEGWKSGLPETACGYGSRASTTVVQRNIIPQWVEKYDITSVADIGAGDLNWIKLINIGCRYTPFDLVPRHPEVKSFNLLTDRMPQADCFMVMWVLNHFPEAEAKLAMKKLTGTKARYLIMSFDPRQHSCTDIPYIEEVEIRPPHAPGNPTGNSITMRLCKI